MADVESTTFINKVLRDRIIALGAIPSINDLLDTKAFNILFNQYINLNGGGSSASRLVFRPGLPSVEPNVFNDFDALYAAFLTTIGLVDVVIDAIAVGGTVTIPATQQYDFQNRAQFSGIFYPQFANNTVINFVNGSKLRGVYSFINSINLSSVSNTPVITISDLDIVIFDRGTRVIGGAASPMIEVNNTSQSVIVLNRNSSIEPGLTVIDMVGASAAILVLFDASYVAQDTITGALASLILRFSCSSANQLLPQAGFLGTIITQQNSQSLNVDCSSLSPANWAGTPTNVLDALERLATAVSGLLGGPIP